MPCQIHCIKHPTFGQHMPVNLLTTQRESWFLRAMNITGQSLEKLYPASEQSFNCNRCFFKFEFKLAVLAKPTDTCTLCLFCTSKNTLPGWGFCWIFAVSSHKASILIFSCFEDTSIWSNVSGSITAVHCKAKLDKYQHQPNNDLHKIWYLKDLRNFKLFLVNALSRISI